jgi:choice-of-anchor C domain-containing protein
MRLLTLVLPQAAVAAEKGVSHKFMKYAFLVFAIAAIAALPALADLEPNGLFLPNPGGTFVTVTPTSATTIPGWTVTPNSVDWIGSYWDAPSVGGYTVDLDGGAPGAITQQLTLGAGSYALSFYLSGNPDGAPSTKGLTVTTGSLTTPFTYTMSSANAYHNMLYQQETVNFTTTGGPTTITFASVQTPPTAYGPVIGGVSLVQTPEAGFYSYSAAYALGFSVLALFAGRKRLGLS